MKKFALFVKLLECINDPSYLSGQSNVVDANASRLQFGLHLWTVYIGGFEPTDATLSLLCQSEVNFGLLSEDMEHIPFWMQSNCNWPSFVRKRACGNLETNRLMRTGFV